MDTPARKDKADIMNRFYNIVNSPSQSPPKDDILSLKFEIKTMRQELLKNMSLYEKRIIQLVQDVDIMKTQLDEKTLENQKLKTDRQFLFNREKEASIRLKQLMQDIVDTKV